MKNFLILLVFSLSVTFVACERPRGAAAACFNTSKTPAKVGDTLYLLNCSLNYDKFYWSVPAYLYIDSLNKHLKLVPSAAGNLDVSLLVRTVDSTSVNVITKTISVQ
jgi:hypothetical protein